MLRAVVIDPSPVIRRVFSVILRDYGFEVRDAGRASEGIALLGRTDPNLVFIDASLTDLPALDVLRHIRDHLPKSTHAIYCTCVFDLLDLQRAQAAGATDILIKPFDRGIIAAKIDLWSASASESPRNGSYVRALRSELMRL